MPIMLYLIGAYVLLALFLSNYFMRNDRGEPEPRRGIRNAAWFGVLAVLAAGYLNSAFLPREVLVFLEGTGAPQPSFETLLQASLTVGIIEESLKFIPLALYILPKRYFNEVTDGVVYFAIAGMWFGVIESITYTLTYGTEVGLQRIIVAPFLHAGFSALAGMGLAKFKVASRNPLYIVIGFGTAIFLHAAYNFFLFTQIPLLSLAALGIAVAVNLGPFRYFKKARRHDERLGISRKSP